MVVVPMPKLPVSPCRRCREVAASQRSAPRPEPPQHLAAGPIGQHKIAEPLLIQAQCGPVWVDLRAGLRAVWVALGAVARSDGYRVNKEFGVHGLRRLATRPRIRPTRKSSRRSSPSR